MLDGIITDHPDVEIIWNIWPLSMFVWTIWRYPLNHLFFFLYIPFAWTWYLWNLFWEGIIEFALLPVFMVLLLAFNIIMTLLSVFIIPLPFAISGWMVFGSLALGFWQFFTIPS